MDSIYINSTSLTNKDRTVAPTILSRPTEATFEKHAHPLKTREKMTPLFEYINQEYLMPLPEDGTSQ